MIDNGKQKISSLTWKRYAVLLHVTIEWLYKLSLIRVTDDSKIEELILPSFRLFLPMSPPALGATTNQCIANNASKQRL